MNILGRPKDPNSIASLGRDTIQIDRPLKARFKANADARNMTQVEYLRYLLSLDKPPIQTKAKGLLADFRDGWIAPGVPVSQNEMAFIRVIDNLSEFLAVKLADSIKFIGDSQEELEKHQKLLAKLINPEYAESRLGPNIELLKLRRDQITQEKQAKMNLNPQRGVAEV